MGKEILAFGDIETEKKFFYCYKSPVPLRDVDIEKYQYLTRFFLAKKIWYFIGYLYNDNKVKPLHIMLPKTSTYIKRFDGQTKWMYFLIEDDDLLEKYNTIWDKVSADIKKNLIASLFAIKNF